MMAGLALQCLDTIVNERNDLPLSSATRCVLPCVSVTGSTFASSAILLE